MADARANLQALNKRLLDQSNAKKAGSNVKVVPEQRADAMMQANIRLKKESNLNAQVSADEMQGQQKLTEMANEPTAIPQPQASATDVNAQIDAQAVPVQPKPVEAVKPEVQPREMPKEFQAFQEELVANEQDNEKLFNTNVNDYTGKIKRDLANSLKSQGLQLDVNNIDFIDEIEKAKTEGINKGVINTAKDYADVILGIAEKFTSKPQIPQESPEITTPLQIAGEDKGTTLNDAEIKQQNIITRQENKTKSLGITVYEDGSKDLPISKNFTLPITSDNKIDFQRVADLEGVTLSAVDLLINYADINQTEQSALAIKNLIEQDQDREQKQYEMMQLEQTKLFQDAISSQSLSISNAKQDLDYQRDVLDLQQAQEKDDIDRTQKKMFNNYKARLSAAGRSSSLQGMVGMKELQRQFANQISSSSGKYNNQRQELAIKESQIDSAFVKTIETMALQQSVALRELYSEHGNNVSEIKKSLLSNEKEKNIAIANANKELLTKIKDTKTAMDTAEAETIKEARKESLDLIKLYSDQSGYMYTLNQNGEVSLSLDESGQPIPTLDGVKTNLDIQKQQSASDKSLSDQTGYMYVNGELALNNNGDPIPTLDLQKFNFDSVYKNNTLALDSQYKMGTLDLNRYKVELDNVRQTYETNSNVQIKQAQLELDIKKADLDERYKMGMLSISEYNANVSALDKSYKTIVTNEGGKVLKLPGFDGTDGRGVEAKKLLDTAEQNKYNPDFFGGQCGHFCNNIAESIGLGRPFADSLESKKEDINYSLEDFSKQPREGFAIYDVGTAYGHVSAIRIGDDGMPYVVDSNRYGDERVDKRSFSNFDLKNIIGFYIPENFLRATANMVDISKNIAGAMKNYSNDPTKSRVLRPNETQSVYNYTPPSKEDEEYAIF